LKLLFLQMMVVLMTARVMGGVLRLLGQPGVVGEMIAGILLGPSLLGRISRAAMNGLRRHHQPGQYRGALSAHRSDLGAEPVIV
jgi:hypothetical protein